MALRFVTFLLAGIAFASFGVEVASAATAPGKPRQVFATAAGDGSVKVTWAAPTSDGGAAIKSYTATASGDNPPTCTWTSGPLTCTVTGLLNGVSYTFTVTAKNSVGTGPASNPSNVVTTTGAPPPPTAVSATAGDQQATVSCSPPVSNGGATITSYTATASPGGSHASATSCPITVTGLTDGTAYTFTVTATSGLGTSAASTASNNVTPVDTHPPSQPSGIRGAIVHGALALSWQGSTDNVGVARYEVFLNGAPILSVAASSTAASVHSFQPHGQSAFTVSAFDAAGNQSMMSSSVLARPTPYPKDVPKSVPGWSWKLLAWQQHGMKGRRPASAPKKLPKWYAAWKRWRLAPFEIVS